MNQLEEITLERPQINYATISNPTIIQPTINNPSLIFDNWDIITIDNESFTGEDLKDLLKMTKVLKLQYPELFI